MISHIFSNRPKRKECQLYNVSYIFITCYLLVKTLAWSAGNLSSHRVAAEPEYKIEMTLHRSESPFI